MINLIQTTIHSYKLLIDLGGNFILFCYDMVTVEKVI